MPYKASKNLSLKEKPKPRSSSLKQQKEGSEEDFVSNSKCHIIYRNIFPRFRKTRKME
jgi:hypothetical protein